MEIKPLAGFTLVPLPTGKFAFVMVEIVGPKMARQISQALLTKPTPSSEQGTTP